MKLAKYESIITKMWRFNITLFGKSAIEKYKTRPLKLKINNNWFQLHVRKLSKASSTVWTFLLCDIFQRLLIPPNYAAVSVWLYRVASDAAIAQRNGYTCNRPGMWNEQQSRGRQSKQQISQLWRACSPVTGSLEIILYTRTVSKYKSSSGLWPRAVLR